MAFQDVKRAAWVTRASVSIGGAQGYLAHKNPQGYRGTSLIRNGRGTGVPLS